MKQIRRHLLMLSLLAVAAVCATLLLVWQRGSMQGAPVRIGVLHALSGTMAVNEKPLVDAVQLAVEEINAQGGVLGRQIELVLADTQSDPAQAAREAQRLIEQEKVSALFGCWTSSCRKAVIPVVERHQHLLFYPLQYEGMEHSNHVLYTGAAPNQQIVPGTHWALQHLGKRVYLLGSDYVFPRTANLIVRDLVAAADGQVLAEHYVPLGTTDLTAVVRDIAQRRPDVLVNTLNGDSNAALFQALTQAGLQDQALLSFSVDEVGMQAWGGASLNRHYGVWSYFHVLPQRENQHFVTLFQQRYGAQRLTSDPIEASYVGVRLWAQAVANALTEAPAPVRTALVRQSLRGPSGLVSVDPVSRHLWKKVRIGRVRPDGQYEQVFVSDETVRPDPWPAYRTQAQWQALIKERAL